MYYCTDCGKKFDTCKVSYERHGFEFAPFEEFLFCPYCSSDRIKELKVRYCRCCGKKLTDFKRWYCNDECKRRGEKLWRIEREKRRRLQSNSLMKIVSKIEQYNITHGTNYSYGAFVANILPKMSKREAEEYI
ncbi:MAG: hypothetical protein J6J13_01730 [Clostridia bacterium]|nr:hypothetical protein [Clostridia bacterium]